MKKLRLKLTSIEFRFLQQLLLQIVTYYDFEMPDNVQHQLFLELYQSKFNLSVIDNTKNYQLVLPRSVALALHQYLEGVLLEGEADNTRNHLYNIIDKYLQSTSLTAQ